MDLKCQVHTELILGCACVLDPFNMVNNHGQVIYCIVSCIPKMVVIQIASALEISNLDQIPYVKVQKLCRNYAETIQKVAETSVEAPK